ncbi:eCIS core domain-containing protein [Sunxiuqinia dokdonensis]|nr:DUF4157 domain-containing protein [Sunxiuqinia dokdonensis]
MKRNIQESSETKSRAVANTVSPVQAKRNNDLPEELQAKMETSFGSDFSNVKIHKNSKKAAKLNALAFTQGEQIHFAPGQFNPHSKSGQELIGHEMAHVTQQRQGRVSSTGTVNGMPMNRDKGLESEADTMGKQAAQAKFPASKTPFVQQVKPTPVSSDVTQFALPAVVAAMGAAEWIAAGALGYTIANDVLSTTSGDVSYSFDEVDGVLLPTGGSDVAAHRAAHPNAQIYEATHYFAIWKGWEDTRKMGIKFGITFLYDDAGAIGNISLSLIEVYDWAAWGGNVNVNITSRSLASGFASFRFTINVGVNNFMGLNEVPGSVQLLLRGGDGDLRLVADNFYGFTEIG